MSLLSLHARGRKTPLPPQESVGVPAEGPKAEAGPQTGKTRLRLGSDGRLRLMKDDETETVVGVKRCFPWSYPLEWLSIRNDEGEELALVESASQLDLASRDALVIALEEAGFVFEVTKILAIEEEFELRQWRVELKEGGRIFQTRLSTWPRELPSGGLLIQDVAADLYLIPDPEALDEASQKLLWAFTDD